MRNAGFKLLLGGLGVGAGLMYLLDPERGTRRRALIRDKFVRAGHASRDFAGKTFRDLRNRAHGVSARARSLFQGGEPVADEVLAARIRGTIGRYASHPRSIEVRVQNGRVHLAGPVFHAEAERLIRRVGGVHGVQEVTDDLARHATAGDVPGLQGGGPLAPPRFELLQDNWTPGTRMLAGGGGMMLAARTLYRRDTASLLLGALGLCLLARSVANRPLFGEAEI